MTVKAEPECSGDSTYLLLLSCFEVKDTLRIIINYWIDLLSLESRTSLDFGSLKSSFFKCLDFRTAASLERFIKKVFVFEHKVSGHALLNTRTKVDCCTMDIL